MPASRSAVEMPRNIAALLPKARRKPVALSQNGKTAAFLVSAREFNNTQEYLDEVTERSLCCDKIVEMYSEEIQRAKKGRTLTKEASLKLMAKIAEVIEEEEDRWCIRRLEKNRKNGGEKYISAEASRKLLDDILNSDVAKKPPAKTRKKSRTKKSRSSPARATTTLSGAGKAQKYRQAAAVR